MARGLIALLVLIQLGGCTGSQSGLAAAGTPDGQSSRPVEDEIEALIHRDTEQEAKDRLLRALASPDSARIRRVECKAAPAEIIRPVRGKPLISVAAGQQIAEILIPHRSSSPNKDFLGGDLTNEKIKVVLFNSRIDEYDRLGRYHLAPGQSFSIRLKDGNSIEVQLYIGAPIGSSLGPNGCSYWFTIPRD
jgi:hypothetical protein